MHFNRFQIQSEDNGVLSQFAYVSRGQLVDSYACYITKVDIEMNQDRLANYIAKVPEISYEEEELPHVTINEVPTFRFIQAARSRDSAELMFLNFPLFAVVSAKKEELSPNEIGGDPVALLSSELSIRRAFVIELLEHTT